jgi:hypothetical protein
VALRPTSPKHGPRGPEAVVGSGDESPRANEIKLRPVAVLVKRPKSTATQIDHGEHDVSVGDELYGASFETS